MTSPRARAISRLAAFAAVCLAAIACAPKTGPDRFVGSFSWRQMFGAQTIAFEKGSSAKYTFTFQADNPGDPAKVEDHAATYRVAGDTAFLVVADWAGKGEPANDTLTVLLRGDSLIMLNSVLGGNPVFMRDK